MLLKRNQASLGISNSFLAHMHTHTHPKPGKTPGGALLLDPGLSCLYFTRESLLILLTLSIISFPQSPWLPGSVLILSKAHHHDQQSQEPRPPLCRRRRAPRAVLRVETHVAWRLTCH